MSSRKSKRKQVDQLNPTTSNDVDIQATLAIFQNQPTKEDVARAILAIQKHFGLTDNDFKKAKVDYPTFSHASWPQVSQQYGLNSIGDIAEEPFDRVLLPPSIHKQIMVAAAKYVSVYNEPFQQRREAARVHTLDAWLVPICTLFRGRMVNRPESKMPPASFTAGGQVEFEVFVLSGADEEGVLLFVAELKFSGVSPDDMAQVLLELSSGYQLNFQRGLRQTVYALLTDLTRYYFFSFDGTRFTRSTTGYIRGDVNRQAFFKDMAEVSEQLFGVLLTGYIDFLHAVVEKSKTWGKLGDKSSRSSASNVEIPTKKMGPPTIRKSLDHWNSALAKAESAETLLKETPRFQNAAEHNGCKALELIEESAGILPNPGIFFSTDLGATLEQDVDATLAEMFPPDPAAK